MPAMHRKRTLRGTKMSLQWCMTSNLTRSREDERRTSDSQTRDQEKYTGGSLR